MHRAGQCISNAGSSSSSHRGDLTHADIWPLSPVALLVISHEPFVVSHHQHASVHSPALYAKPACSMP